jgi:hypothetical protein
MGQLLDIRSCNDLDGLLKIDIFDGPLLLNCIHLLFLDFWQVHLNMAGMAVHSPFVFHHQRHKGIFYNTAI